MKYFKKSLSVLLALCLLAGLAPIPPARAAEAAVGAEFAETLRDEGAGNTAYDIAPDTEDQAPYDVPPAEQTAYDAAVAAFSALEGADTLGDDALAELLAAALDAYAALDADEQDTFTEEYYDLFALALELQARLDEGNAPETMDVSANHIDHTDWTEWSTTDSLPTTAGDYYLTGNVTLTSTWSVPSGETNLCLNGCKITCRPRSSAGITVSEGAQLEICDCNTTTEHSVDDPVTGQAIALTGGLITGYGNNISVVSVSGGTLTLSGGSIAGSSLENNETGVVQVAGGELNMTGGQIAYNISEGGGVHVSDGTFNMTGGSIQNNCGKYGGLGGGGVYVDGGTVTLSGGKITGNTAIYSNYWPGRGGGVLVKAGTLKLTSSPAIYGNFRKYCDSDEKTDSNLFLYCEKNGSNATAISIVETFSVATPIGVSRGWCENVHNENFLFVPGPITTGNDADYSACFTSDITGYGIQYDENNVLQLAPIVTFNANGGSVEPTQKTVTKGDTYGTLPTPTRTGYDFAGWYTSASGGTQVTGTTTVNTASNHTLYAHWTKISVIGVTLNQTSLTLEKGGTATLTATVNPADALNRDVTWSSDDGNVATVSNGTVTAVGAGNATITVETTDGGKTATCSVHVHGWKTDWTSDETNHWYECSGCNDKKDNAAHSWNAGVVTTDATCTAAGVKTYTCTVCGKTRTETVAQLDHSYTYTAIGNVITETCPRGCKHSATATLSASNAAYNGSAHTTASVAYQSDWVGEKPDIVYANNTNAGLATASITIGSATAQTSFTIAPKALPQPMLDSVSYTYDGVAKKPTITVEDTELSKTLVLNTDYTVSGAAIGTAVGTYTITVSGKGNYTGDKTVSWFITKAAQDAPSASVTITAASQTTNSITLNVADADSGKTLQYSKDGGASWQGSPTFIGLTPGTAYTFAVRYAGDANHDPSSASTATATIYTVPTTPVESAFTVTGESVNGRHDGSITATGSTVYEYRSTPGGEWADFPAENLAPGAYEVRIKAVSGGAPESAAVTVTIAGGAANTYVLTAGDVTFADVAYGTQPAAQSITLTNKGNSKVKVTDITVTPHTAGETDVHFTLIGSAMVVDYGNADASWSIQPNASIHSGTHSTTFTVTYHGAWDDGTEETEDQTVTATVTLQVKKQEQAAPGAPLLQARATNSITVDAISDNANGAKAQYSLNGVDWQDGPVFESLISGTKYFVYARYAGTDDHEPSPACDPVTIYTVPAAPGAELDSYHPDYSGHKITVPQGYEYSTDNGSTWIQVTAEGGAQVGVTPGGSVQIRESEKTDDGGTVMPASAAVTVAIPAQPAAPTAAQVKVTGETVKGKKDGGFVLIGATPGDYEYSGDGGSTWVTCSVQENLAPGDYQVRKKATGGSFESVPITITVAVGTVTLAVTFDAQGGSAVAGAEGLAYGQKVPKPANPTRTNYTFLGWYTEAACVKAWDFNYPLTDNMTLYAKWYRFAYDVSGAVTQKVDLSENAATPAQSGATVTLKRGSVSVQTTTTDGGGKYTFSNVVPGAYNVVAEKSGQTVTLLVEVTNANRDQQNLVLPPAAVNSKLIVANDALTPDVVVGGLDAEAEREAKKSENSGAAKVTVAMTVTGKEEDDATLAAEISKIKEEAGEKALDYLEIKVEKTITPGSGSGTTTTINATATLLEIVIPFDFTGKDAGKTVVYRYHGGKVEVLSQTANSSGEYYKLLTASNIVYVYAKNFSTYAIGYEAASGGGTPTPSTPRPGGGGSSSPAVKPPAADAPASGVAAPAVTDVAKLLNTDEPVKFMSGYTSGLFGPGDKITRGQTAQIFYNLLRDKSVSGGKGFSDVPEDMWCAKAVDAMQALGIMGGYKDGAFRPNQPITRGEFAAVAMRFAKLPEGGENRFSDVSEGDWNSAQIVGAVYYGWIGGYSDGTYRPREAITRAQVAKIVNRMLGRTPDADYIDAHADALRQFPDVDRAYWAYYEIMEASNSYSSKKDGEE